MDNPTLRLERRDPAKRMLRFYTLQVMPNLFGEWGLLRVWGRIGRGGQLRMEWFETKEEAHDALRVLEKVKRKRGYRKNIKQLLGDEFVSSLRGIHFNYGLSQP